ncbi:MAG: HlyD family efflux transporter periplasmic adaptor subunit [Rhodobacterales bacterium]|nr:HlyD family efflux transporter periplasmic adaptor subunit [Rhodobacterales bacterium]
MKRLIPLLVILALAAGGWYWWRLPDAGAETGLRFQGNVDIRQVALAFDAAGRITEVTAREGDHVKTGDVIARQDTRALELQAKAQAALVEAQRQALAELRSGARPEEIAQARAVLAAAEAAAVVAERESDRFERLATSGSGAASEQSREQAAATAERARAQVDQSSAALDLLLAGARPEKLAAAEAQLRAAEAQLELLRHEISQGELKVPQDAVVRSRLREAGDIVTAQSPVFALALTDPKWVRIYVAETDLGRITPGMAAEVLSDSFPDAPEAGTVGYISSVAEFTPKAVQTEELRSSLVYEVHVTVDDPEDRLRLGQPVTVTLREKAAP